jgi:hypothetical protein
MQRGLLRWPIWVDIGITFANEITMNFLESKITLVPQDSRPKPFCVCPPDIREHHAVLTAESCTRQARRFASSQANGVLYSLMRTPINANCRSRCKRNYVMHEQCVRLMCLINDEHKIAARVQHL